MWSFGFTETWVTWVLHFLSHDFTGSLAIEGAMEFIGHVFYQRRDGSVKGGVLLVNLAFHSHHVCWNLSLLHDLSIYQYISIIAYYHHFDIVPLPTITLVTPQWRGYMIMMLYAVRKFGRYKNNIKHLAKSLLENQNPRANNHLVSLSYFSEVSFKLQTQKK